MGDYLILLAPSSNRVYAGGADRLAAAELAILLRRAAGPLIEAADPLIEPVTIAGVDYLKLSVPELDGRVLDSLAQLSARLAVFQLDGRHLLPVAVARPDLFDDDLVGIPKYPGKTNEQFTRLLLNVTLASSDRCRGASGATPLSVLDPLCGRGTTLSTGLMRGLDVAGVEADVKAVEAYAAYLKTYLRRKRLKHTADLSPVRRDGKSLGPRLDVEVTPESGPRRLKLTVFAGDTRQSAELYGKRRFDAVVADAPYGVVHGSNSDVRGVSGKRDRSPAGLVGEALAVWAGQLKAGGALGLSWNTFGLTRERLTQLAADAGLEPCLDGPYLSLGHRVDSAIHRDVFVAVKPRPSS